MKLTAILIAGAAMLVSTGAQAQNLITNGDFSAQGANWTVTGDGYQTFGDHVFYDGNEDCCGTISQTFSADAGSLLTLDYDLYSSNGYGYVNFNDVTVPGSYVANSNGHYTFSLGTALSSNTLTFLDSNPPSYNQLRNVVVTAAAGAVPEPASWAMMILGMGAVGFALRSAKRRSDEKFDAKIKRITYGAAA